jgi:hypothetical protein
MHRTHLLGAALTIAALAQTACRPDAYPTPIEVRSYRVGGGDRVVPGGPTADPREEAAALSDQASRDVACPANAIHAREVVKELVYRIEGCQRRGVYLRVVREGWTRMGQYGDRLARLHVARYVSISGGDAASPLRELARVGFTEDATALGERHPSQYGFGRMGASTLEGAMDVLADWTALSVDGARDLACPRDEVAVEFRERAAGRGADWTILAEGCDKRAVYVRGTGAHAFDLVSVVPVNR